MVRIRLQRRGKRNYATYRVVIADQRAPIKGKFIADVGFYNPHTNEFKVDAEAVNKWIGSGAQPTPTIHNLLIDKKIIKGKKVTSWRPKKKEGEEGEQASAASKGAETAKDSEPVKVADTEVNPAQETDKKAEV
ncbi:MAG: 30S ribosomal protein S16 [Candidatus Andersenbacteria bacterium RIFCSPHIGHO2_12_FULL_46_9]|nr:MAG: 30S ribosomal protein S16 [Candidatus Andersenbacteria bacterium RIFCSPHIGHO2_02_FULL_46_16]OGY37427.1 MAG: 30S ribosomal protein S16 [Candidatus Andersenbacteria bacterium RIFCSPLOWO2_02_FULL_46_11]OGY37953.1 MAG: 30S ribosomal protein S16 [Candidatus Andersenbacteria bacterium RIFCSPHIGHO2_12_FULL_46_9]OGY39970.1 MAG: 30S ribosomal protein S16 [Candidatus Andersenbacteria bacterium RIFCSPLOWO2_12_FULL_45_8]HBE90693.1 30S ribosomal protein S16 [Candidatus Andersenbacteria bacterium]